MAMASIMRSLSRVGESMLEQNKNIRAGVKSDSQHGRAGTMGLPGRQFRSGAAGTRHAPPLSVSGSLPAGAGAYEKGG